MRERAPRVLLFVPRLVADVREEPLHQVVVAVEQLSVEVAGGPSRRERPRCRRSPWSGLAASSSRCAARRRVASGSIAQPGAKAIGPARGHSARVSFGRCRVAFPPPSWSPWGAALLAGACGNEDPGAAYKTCASDDDCNTALDECEIVRHSVVGMCTRVVLVRPRLPPRGDRCVRQSDVGFGSSCVDACETDDTCPAAMTCFEHALGGARLLPPRCG